MMGTVFGGFGGALLGEFSSSFSGASKYALDSVGAAALSVGQDRYEGASGAPACH